MIRISEEAIKLLQGNRGRIIHVIDPYKISIFEAIEKARFFSSICPFIIVGSTDNNNFQEVIPGMIQAIKKNVDINVFTHFAPQLHHGYPYCAHADALMATSVLNSGIEYFKDSSLTRQSLMESSQRIGDMPIIPCVALTLGEDTKSHKYVNALPVSIEKESVALILDNCELPESGIFYLFSRSTLIDSDLCCYVRTRLNPNVILIASGCVKNKRQADILLDAGADYVAMGTIFETRDWIDMARTYFDETIVA